MANEPIGMVLAAGLGQRLRPLTYLRPKPAIPLLNRPLIDYALELLENAGIQEVVVNLHYLPDSVRSAASRSGLEIQFSFEDPILGTAGAMGPVRHLLEGRTVVLVNGKIYTEQDLSHALQFHRTRNAAVTLVLVPSWPGCPFNPVLLDRSHRILEFPQGSAARERAFSSDAEVNPYVFTGIHILDPLVLEFLPGGYADTVRDVYPKVMEAGFEVCGFVSREFWCEASTPQRYVENSFQILARRGHELSSSPDSRNVLGAGFTAGAGTRLQHCIAWDRVRLPASTTALNTVFADGVELSVPGRRFQNSVVTPDTEYLRSRMVPPATLIEGAIVWPFSSDTSARLVER